MFAFSQGEANIWYFGNHAGLDFNSGVPVALTNGQLVTDEGCATLSNSAGQLLFYTDGTTIYDKNHQIMPNGTGLMGHTSSTQSATIVPKPGSSTLYYVFTIALGGNPNGFRYSVVDLSLNGGLGAVTADKNVLVYTPTCEKISIVKHANNVDFWVLTHRFGSDAFQGYLLTSSGLSASSVTSNLGFIPQPSAFSPSNLRSSYGYMKISPNGSKLAVVHSGNGFENGALELFDFNNVTGIVSNPVTLLTEAGEMYGAEFSPNNEVLYYSNTSTGEVRQYDLTVANIPSSAITFNSGPFSCGALQLGPDKKIYIAMVGKTKIGVINNPDVLGVGCGIVSNAIDLGGKISTLGLPAFNQSFFFNPQIQADNACVGSNVQFTLNTNQTITSATWDFGDGSPTQSSISGNHVYVAPNTYTVSVTATSAQGSATKTQNIVISALPVATQPANMLVCDTNNDGLATFDLTTQNTAILNGQNSGQFGVRYYANATDYANHTSITTPSTYPNSVAYQAQTIIAEVYNLVNGDCSATTTFTLDVFDSAMPSPAVNPLTSCDNTSVGTDSDGKVLFNLTQRATAILNGQSASQFTLEYYKDASFTNQISSPTAYANTNPIETIYVKVVNNDYSNCFASTSFTIQVFPLPVVASAVTLKQCDDNIDGFSVFNLTQANGLISANAANETFTYFETASDAQNNVSPITNYTTYTNQVVSNDVMYVRVSNANGCFRVATLNLSVSTTQIPPNFQQTFTVCDDAIMGTNTDGVSAFDFSSVTGQIQSLFPVGQQLIITYYRNLADALAEQNAITNTANYRNIGYPNTQAIYIRVDSAINNECLGLGQHITLHVERIPVVSPMTFAHCDDDQDGLYGFDTSNLQNTLLHGMTGVSVAYFDANNNALPSPLPNPFITASQTIKAVVANTTTTGCSDQTTIRFTVDDLPQAFPIPTSLTTVCDDEAVPTLQDGKYAFDTSTYQTTILGGQTGMQVRYYDQNNLLLPSPLPNPFITATQNVRVEVINPSNTACMASETIAFVVQPVPNVDLFGDELVCSNNTSFTKTIDAGIADASLPSAYTYVWKKDGVLIPTATNYALSVNQEGVYTVEVFNAQGCSRTRTITVTASDVATITHVAITDLSDTNSVTVAVSGQGDYVYSLDGVNWQVSNVFEPVASGVYTVYVKDLNGCGIANEEVNVLGIPAYFTPNGDGYHDYWNIKGVSTKSNADSVVSIFDRFGKLIKQISSQSQGWDGTLNSEPLAATDYWYSITLEDGRVVKGHFALKR